ncbi:FG-GAP repeat protein [Streptomyces sp. NPDC050743]|uniref:FG-GAP repeat protein n=1 Tax=Streptomyces sp. NPDC050743 TaxID=3365634 RepID=UPI0037A49718
MNKLGLRGGWRTGAVVSAVVMGASLLSATPAAAVHGAVPGDFNGDGYRDAVLPAPGANVAGKEGAGAVVVLYGARSGLSTARRATITQNTAGVPGTAEANDGFGASTATADLNRDGYADLVVSAPYEDTAAGKDAGTVTVLWGSQKGLTAGRTCRRPLPARTTAWTCRRSARAPARRRRLSSPGTRG